jgi:two-component system phosphate regulon sensor histidine kinase PhoR
MERQRREFASNVSHELKTPLTSIQAYADALLEGGLDDPAINRSFVERILNQSERLGRLVHDLLSLARLEAVAQPDEWESLPLAEVIREVLPEHQSLADARGLELRLEVTDESPRIRADAEGVRTILDNLVRNALSYTPAGGRVLVRLRSEPGRALLEVEDTGVGIPREHQARVFERFFRVDRARPREQGGTGLGLSIVQDLATRFGAEVELESEPGRGSLFRVRFPQAPAPSASAAGPDA